MGEYFNFRPQQKKQSGFKNFFSGVGTILSGLLILLAGWALHLGFSVLVCLFLAFALKVSTGLQFQLLHLVLIYYAIFFILYDFKYRLLVKSS